MNKPLAKKSDKRQRQAFIGVRVSEAEKVAIDEAARLSGKSAAQFLRDLGLGTKGEEKIGMSADDRESVRLLKVEIRRIGTNINQIARAVNERGRSNLGAHISSQERDQIIGLVREAYKLVTGKFE